MSQWSNLDFCYYIYLGQYIGNGEWYDQCLYVAHAQSYMIFLFTLWPLILDDPKSQISREWVVSVHKGGR